MKDETKLLIQLMNPTPVFSIPVIESTFDKEYIYIFHDLTKSIHIPILDLKVNHFRGINTVHNMTNNLFTANLWCYKRIG